MIGFFLKIKRNTDTGVELCSIPYESFDNFDCAEDEGKLFIFRDDKAQVVTLNGYTILNIGTLIYKDVWRNQACELIAKELNSGKEIQDIMAETKGQFCLIIHTIENVWVVTDKPGIFPVYKFEEDNTIQISNMMIPLVKRNKVSLNYQACAEYLSFGFFIDCTLFNEIQNLDMGTIYQFGNEQRIQKYYDILCELNFNKYRDLNEATQKIKEILVDSLSFLSPNDRVFADITGGFDTRTVVTILKSLNLKFDAGICGQLVPGELKYAKETAHVLDVELNSEYKISNKAVFKTIVDKHFEVSGGVPILYQSTKLINYYENIKQNYDIHLMGIAGTELLTQFLPKLGLFFNRIKFRSACDKFYKYVDIFNNDFMSKRQYYQNLEKKLQDLFTKIGSDQYDETDGYFNFVSWVKFHHGRLAGTHNVIMPFYSPFFEADFVRTMFETSYKLKKDHEIQKSIITKLNGAVSLIGTPHGYDAHSRSPNMKNALRKTKIFFKDWGRRFVYQFGVLLKIFRFVEAIKQKVKPPVRSVEIDRSFWVDEVEENWSVDMEIFDLIDKDKLRNCFSLHSFSQDVYESKMKARIIYLNKLLRIKSHDANRKLYRITEAR